jgi:C1A family cysteine protease
MDSIWYSSQWSGSGPANSPNFILKNMGSTTSTSLHAYLFVGWNNNVAGTGIGCFEIHNSHGTKWGNGGRAWMPYSYLRLGGSYPQPNYRYYEVVPRTNG